TGNHDAGVENERAVDFEATPNWWGDASGPSGSGPGTGDSVSDDVDFEPWLTCSFEQGSCTSTTTTTTTETTTTETTTTETTTTATTTTAPTTTTAQTTTAPPPATADPRIAISGPSFVRTGQNATFAATVSNGGSSASTGVIA